MNAGEHFRSVGRDLGFSEVLLEFAPFSELKHTWRVNGRSLELRVSDYLLVAPHEVMESLAWYLVSRAAGRRCPHGRSDAYLRYVRSEELWSQNRDTYLSRARNLSLNPRGDHRDLGAIFDYVNSFYFSGKLERPMLAWTSESPAKRLGFYFAALRLLAVNRVLDVERVPRYVPEFVMYHELLHHVNAADGRPVRRVHHTKEFREQERLFRMHDDAEVWLRRLVFEHKRPA